ncbi:FAD-dependent monooxygenase [Amycolatopsis sp. CA-161197]|uniref:FAD-dependent monooxygenase n=1 Tax=Amycolatopsis sp. CA-161197 TaxID=3239922 RepID=UPI003D8A89FD
MTASGQDTVLVVGAGPVGLTAAAELVRQGARVRVVEQLAEPTTQSRAVVVHPRTQEHLAAMGVLAPLEREASAMTALELYAGRDPKQPTVRLGTEHLATRYRRILDLAQPRTEALLAEHAANLGVRVERGVTLESLEQDSTGVTATFTSAAGRDRSRYAWVVGADGGHSTTRTAVGTRIEGVFEGQHFLFADVAAESERSPDTVRMFAHPDGIGGVFPMPEGRTRLLFEVERPAPGAVPTIAETQQLVDQRAGGAWRVTDAHWLTYFEIHHGQVPRYRHGRVLLAGDAAHIHSPAGGQGMNTGIHDAVNLAWKLALVTTGRADPALLDSYHAERHRVGASVVKQTTRMTDVMTVNGPERGLRNLALFLVGHLPPVREELITGIAEVDIHYRGSPIVTGRATSRRHPHPGDHAPDLPGLRTADGTPTSLDELLRRPGHLLLTSVQDNAVLDEYRAALAGLGTVVPIGSGGLGALHDPDGSFTDRYGTGESGFALIRPDGYLGLITRAGTPEKLSEYAQLVMHGSQASLAGGKSRTS